MAARKKNRPDCGACGHSPIAKKCGLCSSCKHRFYNPAREGELAARRDNDQRLGR